MRKPSFEGDEYSGGALLVGTSEITVLFRGELVFRKQKSPLYCLIMNSYIYDVISL